MRALQHELKKGSSHEILQFNSDINTVREKTVMYFHNQIGFPMLDHTFNVSGPVSVWTVLCVSGKIMSCGIIGSCGSLLIVGSYPNPNRES